MKRMLLVLVLLVCMTVPALATEITAPEAPDGVQDLLPEDQDSFSEGFLYLLRSALSQLRPDIGEILRICLSLIAASVLLTVLQSYEGASQQAAALCAVAVIACLLLRPANALITLGAQTVTEMAEYGKLLLPAMTAAMAAQGGTVTSAALYTATAFFCTLLSTAVSKLLVPMVYMYLVLSIANGITGEGMVQKLRDLVKWGMTWGLKLTLYAFTGFISLTGVISGTTDQAALKATKLTISGMVPVIGGILSDASETILVGASLVKNAVGISGMLVILAIAVGPFLKIGLHYLSLKATAALCGIFSDKKIIGIIDDFSGAMGLLLAMTGTLCLMLMISMVCFLKGVG